MIRTGIKYRHDLSLDFREAIFGIEKELEVPRMETCDSCSGSGIKAGTEPRVCTVCNGTGQVIMKPMYDALFFTSSPGVVFPFLKKKIKSLQKGVKRLICYDGLGPM